MLGLMISITCHENETRHWLVHIILNFLAGHVKETLYPDVREQLHNKNPAPDFLRLQVTARPFLCS